MILTVAIRNSNDEAWKVTLVRSAVIGARNTIAMPPPFFPVRGLLIQEKSRPHIILKIGSSKLVSPVSQVSVIVRISIELACKNSAMTSVLLQIDRALSKARIQ